MGGLHERCDQTMGWLPVVGLQSADEGWEEALRWTYILGRDL